MYTLLQCIDSKNAIHTALVYALTAATKRQILKLKCTKSDFPWGSVPDRRPVGELKTFL